MVWRRWTLDNPVVTKELRGRMRGPRAYWLLFSYLLLLSLTLFFAYLAWWASRGATLAYGGSEAGFTIGRQFFRTLFSVQAILMALITPALTAGAISVEREQRTFDLLRATTLAPRAIVLGKLAASVSFVVLLLTSSLPLISVCFLLGGVSPGEVFFAYLLLVCDAFLFGAMGLAWSAFGASTATATALAYGTLFAYFLVTLPLAAPVWSGGYTTSFGLSALNPLGAVTGAVTPEHYYGFVWPAWAPALLLNGLLGLLLTLACVNRLEDFPARRAAVLRLVTLLYVGAAIFFANGMVLGTRGFWFGAAAAVTQAAAMAMVALTAVLLLVPIFVTGAREEGKSPPAVEAALLQAWTPRQVFGNAEPSSGLPFALLLVGLILALDFAALRWSGSPPRAFAPASAVLWPACGLLLSVTIGLAGLGYLLSVLLASRWASLSVLVMGVISASAIPFFSYASLGGDDALRAAHSVAVNQLYLCPYVGLIELALPPTAHHDLAVQMPAAAGLWGHGSVPIWLVSAELYLVLGLATYAAGVVLTSRRSRNA